jgi:hypothetical protein
MDCVALRQWVWYKEDDFSSEKESLMDIKSLLQEKVQSSLDYAKNQKQEGLKRAEVEAQMVRDVHKTVHELSREVAQYNCGISLKTKGDKIILRYKYGNKIMGNPENAPESSIDLHRSAQKVRGLYWYRIVPEVDSKYLDDAKETIDMITGWCASCIIDSRSVRGRAAKRRAIFIKVVILSIIAFFILLFTKPF